MMNVWYEIISLQLVSSISIARTDVNRVDYVILEF